MSFIAGAVGRIPTNVDKILGSMKLSGLQSAYFGKGCCLFLRDDGIEKNQAMQIQWQGKTYTGVCSGVIYNPEELTGELVKQGHHLEGNTDLELFIRAYAQWGSEALSRINGVFSLAVWNHTSRSLFAARDPMGVRPFFYTLQGEKFLFGSQIKNVLAFPGVKAELNEEGIAELIMLGPGRKPGSGVLRGIFELEPGCCGLFQDGKWRMHRYWKLQDREHCENFQDTVYHVRSLLIDAVLRQSKTDLPFGTFLSGGLDSSILSALCNQEIQKEGKRLSTFSVGFHKNDLYFKPGKFQPSSDTEYIKIMQDALQGEHHTLELDTIQQEESLVDAMRARDLPGMGDVDASMLLACREMGKHVKVALSGECADEIFGGYPWYRDPAIRNRKGFPWAQNISRRTEFLAPGVLRNLDPQEFVWDAYEKTIAQADIRPGTTETERRMKQMVNLNMRWFMQTLIDRTDRMSTCGGLQVRMPFCDVRIAQYLYSVPWEYKDYGGVEKGLLRQAVKDLLPSPVLWRKKSPYPKTYDPQYLLAMEEQLRRLLQTTDSPIHGIVRKEALESLLNGEDDTPWYGQLMKRPQTIAYMLQMHIWFKEYEIQII